MKIMGEKQGHLHDAEDALLLQGGLHHFALVTKFRSGHHEDRVLRGTRVAKCGSGWGGRNL